MRLPCRRRRRHFAYFENIGIPGPKPNVIWGNLKEYYWMVRPTLFRKLLCIHRNILLGNFGDSQRETGHMNRFKRPVANLNVSATMPIVKYHRAYMQRVGKGHQPWTFEEIQKETSKLTLSLEAFTLLFIVTCLCPLSLKTIGQPRNYLSSRYQIWKSEKWG